MKRRKWLCSGQQIAGGHGGENGSDREETGCCSSPLSLFKNTVNHLDGLTLSFHARLCHVGRKIVLYVTVLHKQMG